MHARGALERHRALVVVIDIQERLAAAMPHRERVMRRTSLLAQAAHITGAPVVFTRQYPKGLGDLEPQMLDLLGRTAADGRDPIPVDKVAFDCFGEPEFGSLIEASGRDQLVIAGMETHICVCQTALSALSAGLEVHVVADACCSRDDSDHEIALDRLRHAGAIVTSAESAAYELVGRAGTPEFKALLGIVKGA